MRVDAEYRCALLIREGWDYVQGLGVYRTGKLSTDPNDGYLGFAERVEEILGRPRPKAQSGKSKKN